MPDRFSITGSLVEYAAGCASYEPPRSVPILGPNVVEHAIAGDLRRWRAAILQEPARPTTGGAKVCATEGPASLCAAFLAAATGRELLIVPSLLDAAERSKQSAPSILVLALEQADDALLFGLLDLTAGALADGAAWSELPRCSLVTGRDLAALSWMVAKLVVAARAPVPSSARLRHYAPHDDESEVTEVLAGGGEPPKRRRLRAPDLLASYAEPAEVMAFRTHGSEACAKGGDGTVLCGRSAGADPEPDSPGVLSCGRGLPCPRGPHPVPLARMAGDVVMVGTCNGLRLADSLSHASYNFALSFVDGAGLAYVSSAFSSSGGDVASAVFLAAMTEGMTVSEATLLVNAVLHESRLERTAYLAVGDADHRVREGAPAKRPPEVATLPAALDLGDVHAAEIHFTGQARDALADGVLLAVTSEDESGAPVYACHRTEAGGVRVGRLFRFPEPLGRVRVDAVDPHALQERAERALTALEHAADLWRLVGLDAVDPEAHADLRDDADAVRRGLRDGLARLGPDGRAAVHLARRLAVAEEIAAAGSAALVDHCVDRLDGSFWLPNAYAAEQRLSAVEPTRCPSCGLGAHARRMERVLSTGARVVVVCPRCGIGYDVDEQSAVEAIHIGMPERVSAGATVQVAVRLRLSRAAEFSVHPRLSTHEEGPPPPQPAAARLATLGPADAAATFRFDVPSDLSPTRHYVKVLVAGDGDLAFASRPFFVEPAPARSVDLPAALPAARS